jgi:hypothetical protein
MAFPVSGYTDLIVAFIGVWLDAVVKIQSGQKNHQRVRYYHNPYSIDVSTSEKGSADLEFIWHAISGDRLMASLPVRLRELLKQSADAGEGILAVCEQRSWADPDTQKLEETLKLAKSALRKSSGPGLA